MRLQREAQDDPEMEEFELMPPSEDARMRLLRLFTPSFTTALEALYPRLSNAADWAKDNQPPENLFLQPFSSMSLKNKTNVPKDSSKSNMTEVLPRVSKFILIAAFLASTNPAKSDMRMFGRGPDERKKKRRGGGTAVSKRGGAIKVSLLSALLHTFLTPSMQVPQRLLGPMPFPLDRMISILGVLLEEYDADDRPPAPEYSMPGEYTDMEIQRLSVYSSVRLTLHWLFSTLTRYIYLGDGTHINAAVASYYTSRSTGWPANVQVCNIIRSRVSCSKGLEGAFE